MLFLLSKQESSTASWHIPKRQRWCNPTWATKSWEFIRRKKLEHLQTGASTGPERKPVDSAHAELTKSQLLYRGLNFSPPFMKYYTAKTINYSRKIDRTPLRITAVIYYFSTLVAVKPWAWLVPGLTSCHHNNKIIDHCYPQLGNFVNSYEIVLQN
jgi:hypothetical protein